MSVQNCPCGQGQYATCCQPLHEGVAYAQTAAQLMRSRYSAFALQKIDYIVATTALGQQSDLDREAIAQWSRSNRWLALELVQVNEKLDKNHAMVEFKADYADAQAQPQQHHEQSYFVLHQGRWYFLDPTTDRLPSMKHACVCGSEKKFKHCCAQYL